MIDRFEVRPVVSKNLNSIAGEWSHFDEEWLVKSASKLIMAHKKGNFISNVLYGVSPYWKRIDRLLNKDI